jgi:hypothetical protein
MEKIFVIMSEYDNPHNYYGAENRLCSEYGFFSAEEEARKFIEQLGYQHYTSYEVVELEKH